MRISFAVLTLAIACPLQADEPELESIKSHFKSDYLTVTWGDVATHDPGSELEIGEGNGHGFTLGWTRFLPTKDRVTVVSIRLDDRKLPYESKWPPDSTSLVVKRAQMSSLAYAGLLRRIAIVQSAKLKLKPVMQNGFTVTSMNFWVQTRLTKDAKPLIDLSWAGYAGSIDEVEYAKPRAAVAMATEATSTLSFKEHALTPADRAWVSAKFARDWMQIKQEKFFWWVRERYIIAVGMAGDQAALSTLKDILGGNPKDHCDYHAINAVTRLTKTDVRDMPVEEMDVEKIRPKVLRLLQDVK